MDKILGIRELISVHTQISELERKEAELATPMLTDLEYIPQIFEWFCELSGYNGDGGKLNTDKKMQFLIIIIFFYSPISLTGHRIPNGIRDILTELFGYKSKSAVSNLLKNLVPTYDNYRVFKEEVDLIYASIWKQLEGRGMLPYRTENSTVVNNGSTFTNELENKVSAETAKKKRSKASFFIYNLFN